MGERVRLVADRPGHPAFDIVNFEAWLDGVPPVVDRAGQAGTPGGFHIFEHRWALAEALPFHLAIGKDRVQEWTHTQATRLKEGLAGLAGLRRGHADGRGTIQRDRVPGL